MIKFSKETKSIARNIVIGYSTWNKLDDQYILNFNDIDNDELKKLSASIMTDDPFYSHECFGPENPKFGSIVHFIIRKMQISSDHMQSVYDEFIYEDIINYQKEIIESLLNDVLVDYNHDMRDAA